MVPPIIPFLFYCVSDNITMQEWLYIIYIADYVYLTALIEYLTVLLEYFDLFQTKWQGTANIWERLGPSWRAFRLHHCLKLLYLVFHTFQLF